MYPNAFPNTLSFYTFGKHRNRSSLLQIFEKLFFTTLNNFEMQFYSTFL